MKKIYSLICFALFFNIAKAQFPAPYCAEAYGTGVEPITSVVFGTITNTSPAATGGTAHEDYTSISTDVIAGGAYTMSVQGNTDGDYSDYIRVFIDWNQDGDFADAGESYDIGIIKNSTGTDTITATASILVPGSATLGSIRMRVSKKYNAYQSPCNTGGYGESEDYSINVLAAPGCNGSPTAGTATGPTQACLGSSFALNLSGATVASNISYQWQTTTIGGSSWTNMLNDTTPSIVVIQGPAGADYRCFVTCITSSLKDSSAKVSVALQTVGCPPPNDEPCAAITLILDGASDCQNTTLATVSSNEPATYACFTPNNTLWYKYTPTATGTVQITMGIPATGTALSGWLGVFSVTGTCSGSLTFTDETTAALGACKSFGTATTQFTATLNAGTEYYFMIDGVGGAVGAYCISIQTPPSAPATCATNILPANVATGVSAPSTTLRWNTVATATSYDVYFGTVNPPTVKYGTSTTDSFVVTGLSFNTDYNWYVVPTNTGGSATGCDANVTLFTTKASPPPPHNDECDSATNLILGTGIPGTTAFATQSIPASICASFTGNADDDVWYTFTAPASGSVNVTLTTTGNLDGVLSAYSGTCGSFTDIGCADATGSGGTEVMNLTGLTSGDVYYFRVYSYGSSATSAGTFTILAEMPPNPPTTCPTAILPANAAIDVAAPAATVKWTTVPLATSYSVYFGTVNPPTTNIGTTTVDSTLITGLAYNTTYYWYIVPKNAGGSATGCDANLVSFTTVAAPPAPVNDDCDSAVMVTAAASIAGTNVSATQTQAADVCAGFTSSAANDVWYTFTATQNGNAVISVAPVSNLDLVVIAYSGSCGAFTKIGCSDNATAGATEVVNLTNLVAGTSYYFRIYGFGASSTNVGNFNITASGAALPVSITKFTGERKASANILSWTTATETNSKGFELQHSANGDKFLPLTFVESKAVNGNSSAALNYEVTDAKPYAGNTYYRLKQVDKDGKTNFSNIILIKGDKINTVSVTDVYPNPANRILNLVVASPNDEKATIIVTDITGKVLKQQSTQLNAGNNNLQLNVSNLATGSYMLKVVCNNGCNSSVVKFIKE